MRRKRDRFRAWPAIQTRARLPILGPGDLDPEPEVRRIAEWFRLNDPGGEVTTEVVRDSIDILLDGQRTGRWCYGHLTKTEKTHLGTVIQIELQKEFGISDEGPLDYAIDGIPVDCKYAATFGAWQMPREMYRRTENGEPVGTDEIALVIWAEEESRIWRAGLIRVTDSRLRPGGNQDKKRPLRPEALDSIHWIWPDSPPLPENTLLALEEADRAAIFAHVRSGQARIDELLRRVQHRTLRRTVILTVAQQDDSLKRPRDSRKRLRPEGILVFGHEKAHHRIANELGLDRLPTVDHLPEKGEFLSARVVPAQPAVGIPTADIDGRHWRLARPDDRTSTGPTLPRSTDEAG